MQVIVKYAPLLSARVVAALQATLAAACSAFFRLKGSTDAVARPAGLVKTQCLSPEAQVGLFGHFQISGSRPRYAARLIVHLW